MVGLGSLVGVSLEDDLSLEFCLKPDERDLAPDDLIGLELGVRLLFPNVSG